MTATLHGRRLCTRLEGVGHMALATVLTVFMESHEDTSTALSVGALAAKTLDLPVRVHLVVFQDRHLNLLALVLDFFRGVVCFLLALLGTTTEAKNQVKSGLLLDVVVAKSTAILELLSSEDQTLLVGGNTLLVLDLGFDIVDGI